MMNDELKVMISEENTILAILHLPLANRYSLLLL